MIAALLVAASILASPARVVQTGTVESASCWTEERIDTLRGAPVSLTVCRVAGEIREYASLGEVPLVLYPNLGIAAGVECWYWTSRVTQWVLIVRNADGSAEMGWDPDGIPGGPLVVSVTAPACTAEPVAAPPPQVAAWNLVADYVHTPPDPSVDPPPPRGLAGMETHLGLAAPPPFRAILVSPGTGAVLEAEASVASVGVDWGDGAVDVFPSSLLPLLTGSPGGAGHHVYEVKTCRPPGGTRCHPTLPAYPLDVSFQWSARWRLDGGPWQELVVPPTSTTVVYPVGEVVGLVTEEG